MRKIIYIIRESPFILTSYYHSQTKQVLILHFAIKVIINNKTLSNESGFRSSVLLGTFKNVWLHIYGHSFRDWYACLLFSIKLLFYCIFFTPTFAEKGIP